MLYCVCVCRRVVRARERCVSVHCSALRLVNCFVFILLFFSLLSFFSLDLFCCVRVMLQLPPRQRAEPRFQQHTATLGAKQDAGRGDRHQPGRTGHARGTMVRYSHPREEEYTPLEDWSQEGDGKRRLECSWCDTQDPLPYPDVPEEHRPDITHSLTRHSCTNTPLVHSLTHTPHQSHAA